MAKKKSARRNGTVTPPAPRPTGRTSSTPPPGAVVEEGVVAQQAAKMFLLPQLIQASLLQYLDTKPHSEVRTFIDVLASLREATPAERGAPAK